MKPGSRDVNVRGDLSRRSVLRTGVHAAWVAPVIVAVGAAPAVAASGPALVTTTVSANHTSSDLSILVFLTNSNTGSAGLTTVAVTATPAVGTVDANVPRIFTPDGWVYVDQSAGPLGARTFNFMRAEIPGAASATGMFRTTLQFFVNVTPVPAPVGGSLSSGSIRAVPMVANGTAAEGTGSWT